MRFNMVHCGCKNSFCYIYGVFVIKKHQTIISDFVRNIYFAYFGNQEK